MGVNVEMAERAEKIARRMCRERGMPESLWQVALMDAYQEITDEMLGGEGGDRWLTCATSAGGFTTSPRQGAQNNRG